jgi:hypothetical protein
MKRFAAAVLVSFASLIFPSFASAATFTDTARLPRDATLSPDHSLVTRFNVGTRFATVSSVCFFFAFETDLLDPSDGMVRLSMLERGREVDAGGFLNPDTSPQATREFCYTPQFHPSIVALFLDGRERLKLEMDSGSVTISSLELVIEGIPI